MAISTEHGDISDIKRWVLLLLCDVVPWSDGPSPGFMRSQIVCGGAGCDQRSTLLRCLYSWVSEMDADHRCGLVRPFFFNAFIVTSTRWLHWWRVQETELWSVEVKEIWRKKNKLGGCTLKWCSPGCKRWAPSPWARRHACVPCCLRRVWAHYPGRLGTELGEAVRCSRPQILPEIWIQTIYYNAVTNWSCVAS